MLTFAATSVEQSAPPREEWIPSGEGPALVAGERSFPGWTGPRRLRPRSDPAPKLIASAPVRLARVL